MLGFQRTVNMQQAAAVAGDFASANPRSSYVSHEGGLVAGAKGVTIGRFAWVNLLGQAENEGTILPAGFVARSGQQGHALITEYLGEVSSLIPQGFEVTLHRSGDFYVQNDGTGAAAIGSKVFANLTDGKISTGVAGATVAGHVETEFWVTSYPVGGNGAVGELFVMSRLN